jgi:hypothetical protein
VETNRRLVRQTDAADLFDAPASDSDLRTYVNRVAERRIADGVKPEGRRHQDAARRPAPADSPSRYSS